MPANTRTRLQRLADRVTIADLTLKHVPQTDIAARLGISRKQVYYDLQIIQQEWIDASLHAFDAMRATELARINRVEAEAWAAWERSCKPGERTTSGQQTEPDDDAPPAAAGEPRPVRTKTSVAVVRENRDGDPRFLAIIDRCIERRCNLLGLFAPVSADQVLRQEAKKLAEELGLDEHAVMAEAELILAQHGGAR